MDFQVGEKVRIRRRKDLLCEYGTDDIGGLYVPCNNGGKTYHNPSMAEYGGLIGVVQAWYEEIDLLILEDTDWEWSQNMVYKIPTV